MASLESPHWEAVPAETRQLLKTISTFAPCRRFYLGGGTALAFRLGHRVSRDLDFFDIKSFFLAEARRLAKLWFLPPD